MASSPLLQTAFSTSPVDRGAAENLLMRFLPF